MAVARAIALNGKAISTNSITIKTDDLCGAKTIALLEAHRQNMLEHSPPECVFALDLDGLRPPEITLDFAVVATRSYGR